MSLKTITLTVEATCGDMWCTTKPERATAPTMAECRAQLRHRGWTFRRMGGYERVECRRCASRTDRLVRAGILSKDGYVLDASRYNAELDARRLTLK